VSMTPTAQSMGSSKLLETLGWSTTFIADNGFKLCVLCVSVVDLNRPKGRKLAILIPQYRGSDLSISRAHSSIPPVMFWTCAKPCSRSHLVTLRLRPP
jgi:hypothetical protein